MRRFVPPVWVPWFMLGASLALAVASVALGVAGEADLLTVLLIAALGPIFGVTGAVVVSRRPYNAVGWILCTLALSFELSGLADAYVAYGADRPGGFPAGRAWVAWFSEWFLNVISPALIILCFLLFPTGRLPSARWRPVIWVVAAVAAVYATSAALAPGPLANYPVENPAGLTFAGGLRTLARVSLQVLIVPLMLVSAGSLFVRLRRSSGTERQQLKWFVYAAALLATELLAANVLGALFGEVGAAGLISFVVFLVALSGIPVAMGVAILRHRLYDIDLLINRTLVYGALTVMLVLVYLGGVATTQTVFRFLTGQEQQPQLAVVASTLVIAALFNPFRRRIQAFIDRLFYRGKYDAKRVLDEFSARLRDETDLDSLGDDVVAVVRETMQPVHATIWLRELTAGPRRPAPGEEREVG